MRIGPCSTSPANASTAVHRDPLELLDELAELEREIQSEVVALREALASPRSERA